MSMKIIIKHKLSGLIFGFMIAAGVMNLTSCGAPRDEFSGAEEVMIPEYTPPPAPEKKEVVRYAYHGDRHRDPFIPMNGEGAALLSSEEVIIPKLAALSLKGLFTDGKMKMAIISSGDITYILKGNRLYDNRQRLVKGITGIIKKDSVLMIAPDKTTKELKLREKI